ncbi:MAG: hypothetical protein KGS72_01825 [Cyanobacteria bacterium REEB67]|nr:hypothetical protein [Cyanobacteria bacterium REEB67]
MLFSISGPSVRAQNDVFPWTPKGIGDLGANGVQQSRYGDCWFEAALADVARLPRGQERLSRMITYGPNHNTYVVHFPDNGSVYTVTLDDIKAFGLRDKALWARVVECAQLKRFPNGSGVNDPESGRGAPGTGLHCLTGNRTEAIKTKEVNPEELATFIYSAVSSQNPVLAATRQGVRHPLVGGHEYSIVDVDLGHQFVVLRNPWGSNPGDQSRSAGYVKLSLTDFANQFWLVTRSWL